MAFKIWLSHHYYFPEQAISPYTSSVADCNIIPLAFIQNFVLACEVKKSTNYPCQDVSQNFPSI